MSSPLFAQMVIESQREWIMWWIVLCVVFQFSLSMSIALVCTWHLHASFGPSRKFSEEICEPLDEVEASFRKLLKILIQITELISGSCTYILFDMKWRSSTIHTKSSKNAEKPSFIKSELFGPNIVLYDFLCSERSFDVKSECYSSKPTESGKSAHEIVLTISEKKKTVITVYLN